MSGNMVVAKEDKTEVLVEVQITTKPIHMTHVTKFVTLLMLGITQ
jgi:hypothetical protein